MLVKGMGIATREWEGIENLFLQSSNLHSHISKPRASSYLISKPLLALAGCSPKGFGAVLCFMHIRDGVPIRCTKGVLPSNRGDNSAIEANTVRCEVLHMCPLLNDDNSMQYEVYCLPQWRLKPENWQKIFNRNKRQVLVIWDTDCRLVAQVRV